MNKYAGAERALILGAIFITAAGLLPDNFTLDWWACMVPGMFFATMAGHRYADEWGRE